MMEIGKTARGFALIEFKDDYDKACSVQKSSLAFRDCIWLGIDNAEPKIMASLLDPKLTGWLPYPVPEDVSFNTRMHLTREQVAELIPVLQHFADTGELPTQVIREVEEGGAG